MRKANTFSQPIFRYSEEVHGMKKLLMLTTGGTIASVEGENGLAPGVKADELLSYVSKLDNDYTMETQSLMNIDSTNMQPEYWVEIAEAVKENYDAYDGFVITHGTDTMAYTSAALSYMLQHAKSRLSSPARRFRSRSKKPMPKKYYRCHSICL